MATPTAGYAHMESSEAPVVTG
ncbi:hypothetical protein KIPB_010848, partial [Kipferlia bialata]|eukprot:g10848.t1